jgi:hypothetical protein
MTMKALQTTELSATIINKDLQTYVDLINRNIKPPVPLEVSQVLIRAMYIVSDATNSYQGRFDRSDLPAIARLFIDSPVLIGHDKSGLPVARNFWAETVEKDGRLWIKCYFYWLKDVEGADRLRLNIDSGIYKECSVSFTYTMPECSACGKDIRFCGHQVGDGVFFYYRGVEKILETSLVYRGSVPDTSITNQLNFDSEKDAIINNSEDLFIYTLTPNDNPFSLAGNKNNPECFRARLSAIDFWLAKEKATG